MKRPEVSVIIPVYNHPEWLEEAVESVLCQTFENFEIIVVDDGSTEDVSGLELFKDDRIRYYRNENHGVAYSRNFGIQHARGDYIAFLDSDDIWKKNKLEVQIADMKKVGAVWSNHSYEIFRESKDNIVSKVNTYLYRGKERMLMFLSFKVQTSCFVVKKDVIAENNIAFDESKVFGEEGKFYRELSKLYPLHYVDDYLLLYRDHGDNVGKNTKVQLVSRSDCWVEMKHDPFFKDNTTFYIRIMYAYCHLISRIINKFKVQNGMGTNALYFPAWSCFKFETLRLCRQNK